MKYAGKGNSERILAAASRGILDWNTKSITLDDCIETIRREDPEIARAAASVLFEYFRHKELLDHLVMSSVSRGTIRMEVKAVALSALAQALFQTAIAGESAVNVAVEHLKHTRQRAAAGFLNAVLRNALRTVGKGPFPPDFPDLLKDRWNRSYGSEKTGEMIQACSENPPMAYRLRSGELSADLAEVSVPLALAFTGDFMFFECSAPEVLFRSEAFLNGRIYIQDPATAMSVTLCKPFLRGQVLDACAAPGGKAVLMYDSAMDHADFTAADRSAFRIEAMRENFKRLAMPSVKAIEMDAVKPHIPRESFDLIFIDAPCSNTGVARRRPDVPWRFHRQRLAEVVALQKKILDGLAPLVRSGGALLYSTCSIEPEEDILQVEQFLKRHPEFQETASRVLLPEVHHDGAFATLLVRH